MTITLEQLNQRIASLPEEHLPMPYKVLVFGKNNELQSVRYVRSSSADRATLEGLKIDRFIFSNKKGVRASAAAFGWSGEPPKNSWDCHDLWQLQVERARDEMRAIREQINNKEG